MDFSRCLSAFLDKGGAGRQLFEGCDRNGKVGTAFGDSGRLNCQAAGLQQAVGLLAKGSGVLAARTICEKQDDENE